MPDERPLWRTNEKSFIGHSLVEEGTSVLYTPPEGGEVAENLSPLNAAAQAIVDAQKTDHPDKTKVAVAAEPVEARAPKAAKAAKPAKVDPAAPVIVDGDAGKEPAKAAEDEGEIA
jgi:hypothetical protein